MIKESNLGTKDKAVAHIMYSTGLHICELSHMHFHETIEILYTTKGAIRCLFSDEELVLTPGNILFINSNIPHQTFCTENNTDCALFQFRNPMTIEHHLTYLSEFFNLSNTAFHVFTPEDTDYEELSKCLFDMLKLSQERKTSFNYYLTADIYVLLAIFNRNKLILSDELPIDDELITKIMPVFEYIDRNYSEHLTLDDLAKSVNFHKEYFCRLFKQATGSTVIDYLNFVRVYKAEKLLRKNSNITDVAYRVGFASASYFTKIFKKYRLCSPSTYRRIYENPDMMFHDKRINEKTIVFQSENQRGFTEISL